MSLAEFRYALAAAVAVLDRIVTRLLGLHGVPVTPEQRIVVADALLPHIVAARRTAYQLGAALAASQARAQKIELPPVPPVRPYERRAVVKVLEDATRIGDPGPRRAVVTVDGKPVTAATNKPKVSVAIMDPQTRHEQKVTVTVTDTNRRDPQVARVIGSKVAATAQRHVRMAAREVVADTADSVEKISGRRLGWARVLTGAESCPWCAMLASRGPVYASQNAALFVAGRSGRFSTQEQRAYHTNCDCIATIAVEGRDWPGREQYEQLEQLWAESTKGAYGDDAIKAFAAALTDTHLHRLPATEPTSTGGNNAAYKHQKDVADRLAAEKKHRAELDAKKAANEAAAKKATEEAAKKAASGVLTDTTRARIDQARATLPSDADTWKAVRQQYRTDPNGELLPGEGLDKHLDTVLGVGKAIHGEITSAIKSDARIKELRAEIKTAQNDLEKVEKELEKAMQSPNPIPKDLRARHLAAKQAAPEAERAIRRRETEIIRDALAEIRDMGGHQQRAVTFNSADSTVAGKKITPPGSDVLGWFRENERFFPTDWLRLADERGPVTIAESQRGFFWKGYGNTGGSTRDILVTSRTKEADYTGTLPSASAETLLHENGHRMELVIPGIRELEFTLVRRRATTDGTLEPLVEMYGKGSGERTLADKWRDQYTGHVYSRPGDMDPARDWSEAFQVGLQDVFGRDPLRRFDTGTELTEFVLGALVLL